MKVKVFGHYIHLTQHSRQILLSGLAGLLLGVSGLIYIAVWQKNADVNIVENQGKYAYAVENSQLDPGFDNSPTESAGEVVISPFPKDKNPFSDDWQKKSWWKKVLAYLSNKAPQDVVMSFDSGGFNLDQSAKDGIIETISQLPNGQWDSNAATALGLMTSDIKTMDTNFVAKDVDGEKAVALENIYPGTDILYRAIDANTLKEDIIIRNDQKYSSDCVKQLLIDIQGHLTNKTDCRLPFNEYRFKLTTESGAKALSTIGNINDATKAVNYFTDSKGRYLFHFDQLYAEDAKGNRTDEVTMNIEPVSGSDTEFMVKVTVDSDWLYASDREFPIKIDPTIVQNTQVAFSNGYALNRVEAATGPKLQVSSMENTNDNATYLLWHMNEASGTATVSDSSGNSRNGTSNSTTNVTTSGKFGNARTFNGTSDYIKLADNNLKVQNFSIELWFKGSTNPSGNAVIMEYANTDAHYGWASYITTTGAASFAYVNSTGGIVGSALSGPVITDGNWHHLAVTNNRKQTVLYVDGKEYVRAESPLVVYDTNMNIYFGNTRPEHASPGVWLTGSVDDAKITQSVLTPERIKNDASKRPYGIYSSKVLDLGTLTNIYSLRTIKWTEGAVETGYYQSVDGANFNGESKPLNTSGLASSWYFNQTSGTTATDTTGSNNGTLNNMTGCTAGQDSDGCGVSGWTANNKRFGTGAVSFDGTDDYIEISDAETIDFDYNQDFSVQYWIKDGGINADADAMVEKWANSGAYSYAFRYQGGMVRFARYDGTNNPYVTTVTPITDGNWHMVTGTKNGSTLSIYLDGVLQATATDSTTTTTTNSSSLFLGRRGNGTYYYTGVIDHLEIYNRTLGDDEVAADYSSGNIELQTRTGTDATPEDGGWEEWRPVSGIETAIDSLDTNETSRMVFNYYPLNIGLAQNWIKKDNSVPTTCDSGSACSYDGGRLGVGTSGKGDSLYAMPGTVIKDGSTYKMWYSGYDYDATPANRRYRVYYATSSDGLTWTKSDNSIPTTCDSGSACSYGGGRIGVGTSGKADANGVLRPMVIKDGSTYKMWYTGYDGTNYRILYATSSDGLTWTKANNAIPGTCDSGGACGYGDGRIGLGSSGKLDDAHVMYPAVIKDGSTYKMWYSASDGSNYRLFYATSSDGLTWTKYDNATAANCDSGGYCGGNGTIGLGSSGRADDTAIYTPTVLQEGKTTKMWYGGNDGSHISTNYAVSLDGGVTWTKYDNSTSAATNKISTNGRISLGASGTGDVTYNYPGSVIYDNGTYKIWYTGSNSSYQMTYYATMLAGATEAKSDAATRMEGAGSLQLVTGQLNPDAETSALYHMSETDSGSGTMEDSSPNAVNLTPSNTTVIDGYSGKGRQFSTASSSYASVADGSKLNITGDITIEGWIKPNFGASTMTLIHKQSQYSLSLYVGVDAGKITWADSSNWSYTNFNSPYISDLGIESNKWQHIAITKHSTTSSDGVVKMYLNGELKDSKAFGGLLTSTTNYPFIGCYSGATACTSNYYNGGIDELRISNIARTDEEIAQDYKAGYSQQFYRGISSTDLTSKSKIAFWMASDQLGAQLELQAGETVSSINEANSDTAGLYSFDQVISTDLKSNAWVKGIVDSTMLSASAGITTAAGWPASAVDGNTTTAAWNITSAASGDYIQVDLGAGNEKSFRKVRVYNNNGTTVPYYSVQYSPDGTTWLSTQSYYFMGTTGWNEASWQDWGNHRYWRLLVGNKGASTVDAYEVEWYTYQPNIKDSSGLGVDGQSINVMNPVAAMMTNSGLGNYTAANCIDMSNNTKAWDTDTAAANSTLTLDEGVTVAANTTNFVQLDLYLNGSGYAGDYSVEFSDDNSTWSTAVTNFIPSNYGWNYINWPSKGHHRYWRLRLTNAPGAGPDIYEMRWLVSPSMAPGKIGSGLAFIGDGEKVVIPDTTGNDIDDHLSISMWIKPSGYADVSSGTALGTLAGKWYSGSIIGEWWFELRSGGLVLVVQKNNPPGTYVMDSLQATVTAPLNQWSHVGATFDGGVIKLYLNGQMVATKTSTTVTGLETQEFQRDYILLGGLTGNSYDYNGYMDEVRIDKVVRTDAEFRQIFEAGLRTHIATVDFKANLVNSGYALITGSSDSQFRISETAYGASAAVSNLYKGDRIVIRETTSAGTYTAQATVSGINSNGDIDVVCNTDLGTCVGSYDNGSTFPTGGYTTNASVFKWQREFFDISDIPTGTGTGDGVNSKDAISNLSLRTVTNSSGANIWVDDIESVSNYNDDSNSQTDNITSTEQRYMQYRAVYTLTNQLITPYLSSVSLDYILKPASTDDTMRHGRFFWSGNGEGDSGGSQPFWYSQR